MCKGANNRCPECGYIFKTLSGEVGEHGCPQCGCQPGHDEHEEFEEGEVEVEDES